MMKRETERAIMTVTVFLLSIVNIILVWRVNWIIACLGKIVELMS